MREQRGRRRSADLLPGAVLNDPPIIESNDSGAEALEYAAQTGIVYYEAELHRLDGELRLRLDTADEQRAEASFRRALEIARQQQAKSWELRGATSLARLWGEQGRRAEARDLLAPVYGWFTEGFDTADLREAAALLSELA